MSRHYPKDGKELKSVTTITGASSDKSGLMKWYAKMTAEFIRKSCDLDDWTCDYYMVSDEDLDHAIEHATNEGKRAMKIGSNVHSHIEEFLNARRTSV